MATSTITAETLAAEALQRIAAATAGHQPGETYILTREQFSRFYREELADNYCDEDHNDKAKLWACIARGEAVRSFDPNWGLCPSELNISTEYEGQPLNWWYVTTSGTELLALDWRHSEPPMRLPWRAVLEQFDQHFDWQGDDDNAWAESPADGFYAVTIPAERDQPGRTAWTQVRLAISGLGYRCWMQEGKSGDEVGRARTLVRAALQA